MSHETGRASSHSFGMFIDLDRCNGCGACMDSHEKVLVEAGVGPDAIQTAVRFAGIIQSAAIALEAAGQPVAA